MGCDFDDVDSQRAGTPDSVTAPREFNSRGPVTKTILREKTRFTRPRDFLDSQRIVTLTIEFPDPCEFPTVNSRTRVNSLL